MTFILLYETCWILAIMFTGLGLLRIVSTSCNKPDFNGLVAIDKFSDLKILI